MIKALATDLDGTLLNDNKVSIHNQNALKKLKENQNLLIISTGRPYNGVKPLIENYNLNVDYSILLNGALIMDSNGNVINHKFIPFSTVKKIINSLDYIYPQISIETGYTTYTLGSTADNVPYGGKKIIHSLDEIKNENLSLISLCFENIKENEIDLICSKINTEYRENCIAFRNTKYIDVVPIGCSKGNAVKFVCDKENISSENVYTIGDSFNDVSMFKIAENSFTFTHCDDKLKYQVRYIVDSVAECITTHMLEDAASELSFNNI